MLYRIFKSNHPSTILFIIFLSIILWLHMYINPAENLNLPYDRFEMPLYYGIERLLINHPVWSVVVPFIMLLLNAFLLNWLNASYILLTKTNFMPAIFFIIIVSAYIPLQQLTPVLFASFFFLLALNALFKTYRQDNKWMRIFDAAIFIAIGSMFYIKLAFFLVIIWFALLILRRPSGREFLVSIIGFLIPYAIIGGYLYLFQGNLSYQLDLSLIRLFSVNNLAMKDYTYLLFYGFLLLLIIVSSFRFIGEFHTRKVKIRNFFTLFFWVFVTSVVLLITRRIAYDGFIIMMAIPVSYILSNYYLNIRFRAWANISLLFLLLFVLIIQLNHYALIPGIY